MAFISSKLHKELHKELAARGRCDYYMTVLSHEDFLRCKEYETIQANQASQMIVFIMILFVLVLLIYGKN